MRFSKLVLLVAMFTVFVPAYGQEFTNPSLVLESIEVQPSDFNKVQADSAVIAFEKPHAKSWQVTIKNELLFGNPNGNAVVRFYDANIADKFFEIGMGSPPDRKFWVAINFPDQGYLPATRIDTNGWIEGGKVIAAYNDDQGLSVNNGQRIVVSNVKLDQFVIGGYEVYGMMELTDPPAVNSGTFDIEILSGDVLQNPIHYYPFYVTAAVGVAVGVLLILKKRS